MNYVSNELRIHSFLNYKASSIRQRMYHCLIRSVGVGRFAELYELGKLLNVSVSSFISGATKGGGLVVCPF